VNQFVKVSISNLDQPVWKKLEKIRKSYDKRNIYISRCIPWKEKRNQGISIEYLLSTSILPFKLDNYFIVEIGKTRTPKSNCTQCSYGHCTCPFLTGIHELFNCKTVVKCLPQCTIYTVLSVLTSSIRILIHLQRNMNILVRQISKFELERNVR